MSLVLSMKEGHDFFVGDVRFVVQEVRSEIDFTIRNDKTGRTFEISDRRSEEVLDDVFISAGGAQNQEIARVAIEAPSEVLILRGEKYRNPPTTVERRRR